MEKNNLVCVNIRSRSGVLVWTFWAAHGEKGREEWNKVDLHSENPTTPHRPAWAALISFATLLPSHFRAFFYLVLKKRQVAGTPHRQHSCVCHSDCNSTQSVGRQSISPLLPFCKWVSKCLNLNNTPPAPSGLLLCSCTPEQSRADGRARVVRAGFNPATL